MKIMLITRVYPTHRAGGMPFVVQDRARALAAAGHEVQVVTTHKGGDCKVDDCGVEVFHNHNSPELQWSREFGQACLDHCKGWNPDIVHLDSFDRRNMWWPGVKRVAITMHGFGWGAFLTSWNLHRTGEKINVAFNPSELLAEAQALSTAAVVIGVSKHEHRMLRDEYGLPQARLVYNPIAPYFFGPLASTHSFKGEFFACAAISGQDTRGFSTAKDACARAGVRLAVMSKLPREEMPDFLDRAVAVLLPTAYAQGFDLTIAEARARGVPAIMSGTGSYLTEAEEFDTLIPPHNSDALELAIKGWQDREAPSRALVRGASLHHRPDWHVREWLEAICG